MLDRRSPWGAGRAFGGSGWFLIFAIFFCGVISFTEQGLTRMQAYGPAAVIALALICFAHVFLAYERVLFTAPSNAVSYSQPDS